MKSFVFQWLQKYSAKVGALSVFSDVAPNHVLVNEYEPGQGIMVRRNTSVEKSVYVCFFKIFPWARVLWNLPVICAGFSLAWVAWRFFAHYWAGKPQNYAQIARERVAAPVSTHFHCPHLALFVRPAKTAMLSRLVFHPKLCTPTQNITLKQQQQKRNLTALQLGWPFAIQLQRVHFVSHNISFLS